MTFNVPDNTSCWDGWSAYVQDMAFDILPPMAIPWRSRPWCWLNAGRGDYRGKYALMHALNADGSLRGVYIRFIGSPAIAYLSTEEAGSILANKNGWKSIDKHYRANVANGGMAGVPSAFLSCPKTYDDVDAWLREGMASASLPLGHTNWGRRLNKIEEADPNSRFSLIELCFQCDASIGEATDNVSASLGAFVENRGLGRAREFIDDEVELRLLEELLILVVPGVIVYKDKKYESVNAEYNARRVAGVKSYRETLQANGLIP